MSKLTAPGEHGAEAALDASRLILVGDSVGGNAEGPWLTGQVHTIDGRLELV